MRLASYCSRPVNYHLIILIVSLFIAGVLNGSFDSIFNENARQSGFSYLIWLKVPIHACVLAFALELVCWRVSAKPLLCLVLLLSSLCGFYMERMGVKFDEDIIQSVFETHASEAFDMISLGFALYVLCFGILPCALLCALRLSRPPLKKALLQKLGALFLLIAFFGASYVGCGRDIIFIFKSYKPLENMLNPISPIRALVQYARHSTERNMRPFLIAQDAKLARSTPPQVVVLFIGESARAANFSLNGYARETNPYTESIRNRVNSGGVDSEALISFKNFYSSGVITAISVPCMLTHYTHKTYTSRNLSLFVNNILDIAKSVGYEVWYLGNNGASCVGGCDRNLDSAHKRYYAGDSLDSIMLPDMEKILRDSKSRYIFIIMHGYGSHGASYFIRYPQSFEKFQPVCKQKELSKCAEREILNAYDNSILYNDFVLSSAIKNLERLKERALLWYVSDHGESLGEYGQYMHGGLGYTLAPEVQKHIPSILWFSKGWGELPRFAKAREDEHLSHDYIFHTLLHILGVQTEAYDKRLDITAPS